MRVYPARFLGEIDYKDVYHPKPDAQIGDVYFVHRTTSYEQWDHGPYIAIRCACGDIDIVAHHPFKFSNGASWQLTSRSPTNVHVDPSIRTSCSVGGTCHYFVHNGQLQMLDDTTSKMKETL